MLFNCPIEKLFRHYYMSFCFVYLFLLNHLLYIHMCGWSLDGNLLNLKQILLHFLWIYIETISYLKLLLCQWNFLPHWLGHRRLLYIIITFFQTFSLLRCIFFVSYSFWIYKTLSFALLFSIKSYWSQPYNFLKLQRNFFQILSQVSLLLLVIFPSEML